MATTYILSPEYDAGISPVSSPVSAARLEQAVRNEPPHMHDHIEMLFVLAGCGALIANGERYLLEKHSFVLLLPHHIHSLEVDSATSMQSYIVQCDMSIFTRLEGYQGSRQEFFGIVVKSPACITCSSDSVERIKSAFSSIVGEMQLEDCYSATCAAHWASLLALSFVRQVKDMRLSDPELEAPAAWRIYHYIYQHHDEPITPDIVGRQFGLNAFEVNRLLRSITGEGFGDVLHRARIVMACALMRIPEYSIQDISMIVGYSGTSTFYRVFGGRKGMPPEQYRSEVVFGETEDSPEYLNTDLSWKIMTYIYQNYSNSLTPVSVAEYFNISVSQMSKLLSRHYNTTFSKALTGTRLMIASSLLRMTDLPIYDVAIFVGFESGKTLSRHFQKAMDISPSEYRAKMKTTK